MKLSDEPTIPFPPQRLALNVELETPPRRMMDVAMLYRSGAPLTNVMVRPSGNVKVEGLPLAAHFANSMLYSD